MNKTFIQPIILLVLIIVLCARPVPGFAQEADLVEVYREDFEDGQAQGWDLSESWAIISDEGNQVLAGAGHHWAFSNQLADDSTLSFRVKVLKGGVHLNYRYNADGRYFISFEQGPSYLSKQLWPDEFFHGLAGGRISHALSTWYQVEISGQGSTLQLSVDGKVEWTYTDPEPLMEGIFAFESLPDSSVIIDDIVVKLPPSSAYLPIPGVAPASAITWVRTGGPLGGLGYDVRMRPDQPDTMFVTDAFAGVFRSTDGGLNWSPSHDGITTRTGATGDSIPIFCLSIDPTHPNILWAGTQNARGLFRSGDGGLTWEERVNGIMESDGITFRGIAVDPTNSDIVYAAGELSSFVWNNGEEKRGREFDMTQGILYKTTDGGLNWKEIWRGQNLARYVWINPLNTNVLYLSTGLFDREAANSDPLTGDPGGEGVLKSVDGGSTWVQVNNGLNNLYVGSLFMHPTNPDILLAATGNVQYHEHGGVYRTEDGGQSWAQVTQDPVAAAVEIMVSDPSIAYAVSTTAVYRSTDGGKTWKVVAGGEDEIWGPEGVNVGIPIDLQVDFRNPDRLFVNAYNGGNFLSEDGGHTWVDASQGYTGAQVRFVAVDPDHSSHVFAAARSGLFESTNGGGSWQARAFPPVRFTEWNVVAFDPTNPQHILAATNVHGNLVKSFDGGLHWLQVQSRPDSRTAWRAIAFSPSNPKIVYAGNAGFFSAGSFDPMEPGSGIYLSQDSGKTWLPANDSLSADAHVANLAVDPTNEQVVFAATTNHGLLKTTDGGQRWQVVENGLPVSDATIVVINPVDPNHIFAGFPRRALYVSTDGGETWNPSMRGLMPEGEYTSIVFDPQRPGDVAYLSDLVRGVFRSTDGGKTWLAINNGLTMHAISHLAISTDGQHLYAASDGGGVFRLDLNGQPPPAFVPTPTPVPPTATVRPTQTPTATLAVNQAAAAVTATPASRSPVSLPCGSAFLPLLALGLAIFARRLF